MHRTKHLADRSGDCLLRWDYYEFHKQRLLGATCGTGIVRTELVRPLLTQSYAARISSIVAMSRPITL